MKLFIALALLISGSGCAVKVTHDDVKPITVNHNININIDLLSTQFKHLCMDLLVGQGADPLSPDFSKDVNYCAAEKVTEFLSVLDAISAGVTDVK